jgi:hypothetical protein
VKASAPRRNARKGVSRVTTHLQFVGQAFLPDRMQRRARKPDLRWAKGGSRKRACSVIILERANQPKGWGAKLRATVGGMLSRRSESAC